MAIDVRWIYKAFLGLCMGLVFQFTSSPSVAIDFIESPTLQRLVESGELPAVENRLPTNPMMIQPVTEMGEYGGTWRMGMRRGRDHALLIRTMGYENLLRWNSEWTGVEENIAQIYSVDETSTSYRFVLREGMKWSDGDPFDTEDIRFWYEDVALNPALAEGVAIWRFSGGKVPRLEIHGPYEFSFKFEQPHALFSQFLAAPEGAEPTSYPSHYLKQFLPKYNSEVDQQAQAAGFGNWVEQFHAKFGVPGTIDDKSRWSNPELPTLNAWILDSKFGVDEPLHAKRNPYYWKIDPAGKQLPYIENLVYQVVKSKGDIRGLAAADTIDMQLRAMASFAEKVNDQPADWAQYRTFGAIDTDMNKSVIALNLTHRDPILREIFNKRDFRIALSVAIDRASIIRGASENIGIPFQAAPRPESPFYDEKMAKQFLEYAPKLANELLDELGLEKGPDGLRRRPDGKILSFFIDTVGDDRYEILKHIAQNWREVGVDVTARNLERTAFYDERALNEHDASSWGGDGGIAVIQSPIYYFPFTYESLQAVEWARWFVDPSDPKAMEPVAPVKQQMGIYRQIVNTQNQAERDRLMREILKIARDEFYVFGVSLPPIRYGIYRSGFVNVPALMPAAWTYPTPAPTNPAQYFFKN